MLKTLKNVMQSGKVYRTGRPLPSGSDEKLVYVLLGRGSGALTTFLRSGLARQNRLRTVVAPRHVRMTSRPGKRAANAGLQEALAAKAEKLISRVVHDTKAAGQVHFVVDLTSLSDLCEEVLANVNAKSRHEEFLRNLTDSLPQVPEGFRVVTVLMVSPEEETALRRLKTLERVRTGTDHVLRPLIVPAEQQAFVRDPYLLFVMSSDGSRVSRIDVTDTRTNDPTRVARAINGVQGNSEEPVEPETMEADEVTATAEEAIRKAGHDPRNLSGDAAAAAARLKDAAERVSSASGGGLDKGQLELKLNDDPEYVAALSELLSPPPTPEERRKQEIAEKLRAAQGDVEINFSSPESSTVHDLLAASAPKVIVPKKVPGAFLDEKISKPRFSEVTKSYVQSGTADRDFTKVLTSLNDVPERPFFVRDFKKTDASDSMSLKDEVEIEFASPGGRPTTVRFDMPKLTRDGQLFLNGTKRTITKQLIALPVIKIRPDEVLITTAYNKAILSRFGQNSSPRSTAVKAVLLKLLKEKLPKGVKISHESATAANTGYVSSPEYDDVARSFFLVSTPESSVIFSRPEAEKVAGERVDWAGDVIEKAAQEGAHVIGVAGTGAGAQLIFISDGGSVYKVSKGGARSTDMQLDELIFGILRDAGADVPAPPSASAKKYAYSRVKMLSQHVSLAVALGIVSGIMPMLERAGIKARFLDAAEARRALREDRRLDSIEFEDGILVYPALRMRDTLLVNGLKDISTEGYSLSDFGPEGRGWIDYVVDVLGSPNYVKALKNFAIAMIDPIIKEILGDMKLPQDFVGVMLHANSLLEGNQYKSSNDLTCYRVRGPELLNAIVYKALHKELERVRATKDSAVPQKLSLPKNHIVNALMQASNVEEAPELNPLLEAESIGKVSWTGAAGGIGDGRMVTREARAFDKSFRGIFGFYSPDSDKIGVSRSLSYGAMVQSVRGYLAPGQGSDAADLLAFGELMSPFTARHADPPRVGMQSKQATHTMPVKKHSPQLVGSGAERALAHVIGQTFAYKARADGIVDKIDNANSLVRLKHKDGSYSFIDLSPRSVKNSGGGFYITSQLTLDESLAKGSKFKQGDILAHDENFFEKQGSSVTYKPGVLVRTAIVTTDQTYEDSIMVSRKLTQDTVSEVTMTREIGLGAKANLRKVAKIGDAVLPSTPLAIFENLPEDTGTAEILARIGKEYDQVISELAANVARAKEAGVIIDIKTYYNRDVEELSPSLRSFVRAQERRAAERRDALAGAPSDEPIVVSGPERVQGDKVLGRPVDGVLIIFYIKTQNEAGPGDKFTTSATKGIVSTVFEPGTEPVTPDGRTVDFVMSPLSTVSRMTNDVYMNLWTNSILIGLKERVGEILKKE